MSLHFCASKIGDFRIFAMAFFILTYIQYYKRAMSQGLIQNEQTILKKKNHPKDKNLFTFLHFIIKLRLQLRVATIKKASCAQLQVRRTFVAEL